jgi:cytochrome P450
LSEHDSPASTQSPFAVVPAGAIPEALERLREQCPVARVRTVAGQPAWLVLRDMEVRACFVDPRLTTNYDAVPGKGTVPGKAAVRGATDQSLLSYDPERHARVRRLTAAAFSGRRLESLRPRIADIAAGLARKMPSARATDVMAVFARPFAFTVLCEVFGIAHAAHAELYDWMSLMFDHRSHPAQAFQKAADGVEALVRAELADRRQRPRDDAMSVILAAWQADGSLTQADLISLHSRLLRAGADSVAQMIGAAIAVLLARPADLAWLRAEQAALPPAVEELLRWTTPGPFSTPRWATEDILLNGTLIPRGSKVIMAIAAANRDPRAHDDPGSLRLGGPDIARHVTFGLGPHFCPGAALARIEVATALDTLISAFPAMRLACGAGELRWRGIHHRQLLELPVELAPASGR